jgi:lipopolysaccharide transport system permease protein
MNTPNQTIIEPKPGWQLIDWRELREYKDLLYFLVWRDIKVSSMQMVFRLRVGPYQKGVG